MNDQDYTLLSQYLDGELAPEAAQRLRARLLAEPDLRAAHDRMARADAALRDAFDFPGVEAVPQQVSNLLVPAAGSAVRRAGWGLALAASVLVATGVYLDNGTDTAPSRLAAVDGNTSVTVDNDLLSDALSVSPSRADGWVVLEGGGQLRPVLTFANRDGAWCREYLLASETGNWRGVACLESGRQWATRVLSPAGAMTDNTVYRPAGADSARDVSDYIEQQAADVPLGAAEEAALITREWR